jgi:sodium transport system permease protein
MTGQANLGLGVLVLTSTTLYAIAALAFAARAFGSERVLFGGGEESEVREGGVVERWRARLQRGGVPDQPAAVLFVAFVAVFFFWGGIQLQIRLGERGLFAAEWLLLFVPAVVFVFLGGYNPVRTLSLRRPGLRSVAGGLILTAGAMPLVWVLGWLQSFVLPIPWELLEGLEQLVTAESATRLAWLLLLLAVTPAICEEIVFRGVLLGGTRTLEPWRMIVLNGVVFGAFHLSFETVIRFLPTATLGMVIAWAVWRTGSIWIGALMHLVNTGTIVLLASTPSLREMFADPEAPPPLWLVPVALILFGAGVHILLGQPIPEGDRIHSPIHES